MSAADVDTIEDILRQYDVDGLLDPAQFSDLVDELRNRESVMIEDSVKTLRKDMPPVVGDILRLTKTLADFDLIKGTTGPVIAIMPNEVYKYLVKFDNGTQLNLAAHEFEKVA